MPSVLPRLRNDLDFLPSPLTDRPGLLVRDPMRYSEVAMVLPPLLVRCLACFDGAHSAEDLRMLVINLTGGPDPDDITRGLVGGLSESGFLDDDVFRALRATRRRAFASAEVRPAAFAGGGYPDEHGPLRQTLETWTAQRKPVPGVAAAGAILGRNRRPVAIAAPHVSPEGGASTYAAAYGGLGDELADRTFVILGTSHYGPPNRFGLTRKSFQTPFGEALTDVGLVDHLERMAPGGVDLEDYCHAIEHSIEFQVLFLQHRFGPRVKILPILCGPMICQMTSQTTGQMTGPTGRPEEDPGVARVLGALAELQAARGASLFWILGVDMAHVGRRYGDPWSARAHDGPMSGVAERDRKRLERVLQGDADGFWTALHEQGHDDLRWCGSAPLYTFLRAHPGVAGQILEYEQWNIDPQSVVSFAALSFEA